MQTTTREPPVNGKKIIAGTVLCALAALLAERKRMVGKTVGIVISGGNADAENIRLLA